MNELKQNLSALIETFDLSKYGGRFMIRHAKRRLYAVKFYSAQSLKKANITQKRRL